MNQGIQDIDAKAEAQTNEQQLICLNQTLLESVVSGDWLTYASHCSVDLTCFEAETNGVLAEGLASTSSISTYQQQRQAALQPPYR